MQGSLKHIAVTLAALAVSATSFAGAVEDGIKKAISPLLEGVPVTGITKTNLAGLYEVDTPRGIIYTDKAGSFVIFGGTVVDSKTKANLTQQRMTELGAFKFSELPLTDAIKTVHGDGSRVLVTVEDPNCGYCKRNQQELAKLKNVTIYTFLYPILGEDSVNKSKAIWCATDRAAAWNDYMRNGKPLPEKTDCQTPIERNYALGQKLRVTGTPAILFPNGQRIPGAAPAEQIEAQLAAVKK